MFRILCISVILFFPAWSHAQVLINEIAWMGTDADANDEWIELRNSTSGEVTLDGWTLSDGNALTINLAGTLKSNEIVVLERTDDNTLPQPAFLIYTGALPNGGATLTLRDSASVVIDQVVGGTNWSNIGGLNTIPKQTPQRTESGSWVTGIPTPGAQNIDQPNTESQATGAQSTTVSGGGTILRGGSGSIIVSSSPRNSGEVAAPQKLTVSIKAPSIAYVNQAIHLEVIPEGIGKTFLNSLKYIWNFGDTYTAHGRAPAHVFKYPGEYFIVVQAEYGQHTAMSRHEITVLETALTLQYSPLGDVIIKNDSRYEIDIGGFIVEGNYTFVFPQFTYIKPQRTLTLGRERVGTPLSRVVLYDPQKTVVATILSERTTPSVTRKTVSPIMDTTSIQTPISNGGEKTQVATSTPIQKIIQIGTYDESKEEGSIFNRLWKRIAQLF